MLGGPEIWIKRDDLLGLAGGGNKTRKLEFLVADALAQGADTLITVGAVQSNHCRLTLAAAAKEGLKCRLVLEQRVAGQLRPQGHRATTSCSTCWAWRRSRSSTPGADLDAAMQASADELAARRAQGLRHPRRRLECARRAGLCRLRARRSLAQALRRWGWRSTTSSRQRAAPARMRDCSSACTRANARLPLTGINVRRPRAEQEGNVHKLAAKTAALLDVPSAAARRR